MKRKVHSPVIGLVVPAFDKGGLEQVVLNLYRGYRAAGAECVVLVENNEVGYMARQLSDPRHCFIFNQDEGLFLKTCHSHGITHLHYHYSTFGLSTTSALGFDTTYTLHNIYTWLNAEEFQQRAAQIVTASRVVAVSAFVRDYFCKRAELPWEDVLVVSNGTDVDELFRPGVVDVARYRSDLNRFVFANVASSHRNKHHSVMLRAAEKLLEQRDDFTLLMVGNVGDAIYHQEVADLIVRSPAVGNVRQLPYLDSESMGAFYRDVVDCVLLPSIQEGCSNVVLEALATGRRMILTDVGNARDAAALSDRVIVVPPAWPDLMKLSPTLVDSLSRTGDVRNVDDIADAMLSMIEGDLNPVSVEDLAHVQARVAVSTMVESYYKLLSVDDGIWSTLRAN